MAQTAPAAHFNLFLLRNFLDAETCAKLRAELTEAPTTQAPVYIQGEEGVVHQTVRKTTSVHPAAETFTDVHARLLQQKAALEQHFGEALHDHSAQVILHSAGGKFALLPYDAVDEAIRIGDLERVAAKRPQARHAEHRVAHRDRLGRAPFLVDKLTHVDEDHLGREGRPAVGYQTN